MKYATRFLTLALAIVLASCAGSTPDAKFSQKLSTTLARADGVSTTVTDSSSKMLSIERGRLGEKITNKIRSTALPGTGAARNFEVAVNITRYDKGNAFARAMLAGLGQIHLDGVISVYQLPGRSKVGEFTIKKTFAWGGVYGGITNIETIEDTFAEAVAKAVCGTK
jgi:hypothetical protein